MKNVSIVLVICLVTLGNSSLLASGLSTARRPSVRELMIDETDEAMRSAKAAIEIINSDIKAKDAQLSQLITKLQTSLSQVTDTSWVSRVKSILDRITKSREKLRVPIGSMPISERIEHGKLLSQSLAELDDARTQIEAVETLIEKERAAAVGSLIVGIVTGGTSFIPTLASSMTGVGTLASGTAHSALIAISNDRLVASKLLEFVRTNNLVALRQLLKAGSPADVDVREVKDSDGLLVIFRVDGLTHCLSTKKRCGGKPYSVTK